MKKNKLFFLEALIITFLLSLYFIPSICAQEDSETELFLVAQKAVEDGFYDVAIRYTEQFLEQYPNTEKRMQANLLLGQCYFFKEQYLKAFEIFKGLSLSPGYQDAVLFWLGETYLKGKDYAQARAQYQKLLQVYPRSDYAPQAYYALGWVNFEQENYSEALKTFSEFTHLFPGHSLSEEALFRIGECEFNLNDHVKSIEAFDQYLKSFPKSTRLDQVYFYIAESNYYLKKYVQAVKNYAKAKDASYSNKTKFIAEIGAGWSYSKLNEFEQAVQSFQEALDFATKSKLSYEDALFGLASLFTEAKDLTKALKNYERIITELPENPRIDEAYLGKANLLYSLERYNEAITEYQGLINHSVKDADFNDIAEKTYLGLAWTYMKSGQLPEALKNFQYIAEHTKNKVIQVSALTQIADAYQDLNQFENAVATYDKILKNFPNTPYTDYAQYRQGIALLKMEKIEGATLSFQSLQEKFPNSKYLTDVDYYLGVAYFKKNDWIGAKEKLLSFINALSPTHEFQPDANYILGLCFFYLNDSDEAIKIFRKIKRLYPDNADLVLDSEFHIALSLYNKGDVKEALKEFKIIAYKHPGTKTALDALMWLGEYYSKTFDFDNAITYYGQVVNDFPKSPTQGKALLGLGNAYYEKSEFDKALNQFKQIDETYPEEIFAKAKMAIANTFAKQIDPETAIETYQSIVDNSPEFQRSAHVKIAQIYKKNKNYERALAHYQKALDSADGLQEIKKSEIHFLIGDIYEILNNQQKAIEEYLKIPYLYPKDTRWVIKAYLRVAKLFENAEEWDDAVSVYEKIMAYEVDERTFAQERLDWIRQHIFSNE